MLYELSYYVRFRQNDIQNNFTQVPIKQKKLGILSVPTHFERYETMPSTVSISFKNSRCYSSLIFIVSSKQSGYCCQNIFQLPTAISSFEALLTLTPYIYLSLSLCLSICAGNQNNELQTIFSFALPVNTLCGSGYCLLASSSTSPRAPHVLDGERG